MEALIFGGITLFLMFCTVLVVLTLIMEAANDLRKPRVQVKLRKLIREFY